MKGKKDFLWIARDLDGELWVFKTKPVWNRLGEKFAERYWYPCTVSDMEKGNALQIPNRWFPRLKPGDCMKVGIFEYLKDGVIGGSCLPGKVLGE